MRLGIGRRGDGEMGGGDWDVGWERVRGWVGVCMLPYFVVVWWGMVKFLVRNRCTTLGVQSVRKNEKKCKIAPIPFINDSMLS